MGREWKKTRRVHRKQKKGIGRLTDKEGGRKEEGG